MALGGQIEALIQKYGIGNAGTGVVTIDDSTPLTVTDIAIKGASSFTAITPADSNITVTRGLYIGGSGNLVIRGENDATNTTLTGIAPGVYPFRVIRVAAATTATGIVALR